MESSHANKQIAGTELVSKAGSRRDARMAAVALAFVVLFSVLFWALVMLALAHVT